MFFVLSKIFWFLAMPLNALCLLALAGMGLRLKWERAGAAVMTAALVAIVTLGLFPVGPALLSWWEHKYQPPAELPARVAGVIVLGGAVETHLSAATNQINMNDSIERMICFNALAQKYPHARLVFTGGSGDILNPEPREADIAADYFDVTGLKNRTILYEKDSRNTYENADFSKELVNPSEGQNWILLTSAFHMPRSVGIFEKAGWKVIPYPCDYRTDGNWQSLLDPPQATWNYMMLNLFVKELIGSVVYYVTGKSAFILPPASATIGE